MDGEMRLPLIDVTVIYYMKVQIDLYSLLIRYDLLYSLLIRYDLFINFFLIKQKVHATVHWKACC
jgi:hypothetical protein